MEKTTDRVWCCPKCGAEYVRTEGQVKKRCTCGSVMEAVVIDKKARKVLGFLED